MDQFLFFTVSIFAMLLFGISKGGFAGTAGFIALPIMATVAPLNQAVSIMLPVLCIMDLFALKIYWNKFDKKNVLYLVPASLIGITIGGLTFDLLNAYFLKIIIALLAIVFFSYNLFLKHIGKNMSFKHDKRKSSFWGMVLGFTSTIAHAGGVPMHMYLLPQKLDKTIFIGTSVIIFTIINYIKLIPYYFLGELNLQNLHYSLFLLPVAPIGIYLGYILQKKIEQKTFYNFCSIFLFLAVLKLFYDGVLGLFSI